MSDQIRLGLLKDWNYIRAFWNRRDLCSLSPEDVVIYDDYIGEGYAIPTEECVEAIKLVARTEGLLLDPVYTGKAMAGLVDLVRKGAFGRNENLLFVHTGGTPGLFAEEGIFDERRGPSPGRGGR